MITVVQDNDVYKIHFHYDANIVELVKEVPGRRFDGVNKYWTIPKDRLGFLLDKFKGTPYEHLVDVYNNENISENATLDATTNIPDIDISDVNHYVEDGSQLFPHQLDFLKYAIDKQNHDDFSGFILADQMGLGKALSLDTRIYTPTGYKLMRDIAVNDYVMGKNGKPTRVTAVYDHKNVTMYRITFSDGVSIDCCKDHLWQINDQSGTKVVPTSWFLEKDQFGKIRKDHLTPKIGNNYKYWISRCSPVEFSHIDVPLDPYLLGILLGDGGITHGVQITTADPEILSYITSVLPDGHYLRQSKKFSYSISSKKVGKSGNNKIINALRILNLFGTNSHTKFVPDIYKYNSVDVRKAVLQGLLDTDGYCGSGNILQYTTVSQQLAEDVRFLVESFGGLVSWSEKQCGYAGKITGTAYTLTLKLDNPQEFVRLPRRKNQLSDRKFKPRRNIVSIEQIDNADARCISVDNDDKLYLIDHFVVTHNTIEFINLALYNRERYGIKHCLIIVCLNSAKYNWASEITKHTNGQETPYILGSRIKRDGTINTDTSSADKLKDLMTGRMYGKKKGELLPFFIIMNIEAIRFKQQRHFAIREQLSLLCNNDYIGMIAVDEIHRNASAQSQNGRQLLELKKSLRVPVEWIPMTGTPIVNKPTDVYVPLKLVDGHHFTSFYKWQQNFCVFGGFGDHEVLTYKNIPELKEWLHGKMLRRLKKDVLDLPEKLHTIEYVDNTPYQMQLYRTIVVDMLAHSEEIKASSNPAVKFLRLRQVNGCPELVDTELKVNNDYLAKNAKLQRLLELVVSIVENGEKVVIFSNWVETLRTIYRFLASRYKVCVFTGTMKQQDREAHKQKFINDPNYMILMGTTEALGVSHTLTVAHNVIFYDEPWNYAKFEQAEDRCHRAGTTSTVNVYSLITRDTVDDKVHNMIMTKDGISKYIVDGQLDFKNNPQLVEILLGKSK